MAADVEDRDLIQKCQGGDKQAFQQLLERYQTATYAIGYNILNNYETARDISQEAWLKIYFNIYKFDLTQKFYPWLFRIVTNLSIDYIRGHKNRPKPVSELVEIEGSDAGNPAVLAETSERQKKVRELLEKLPVKYRTILVLRDIEGLPSQEVAEIIKSNDATVRWRLYKARKLFKEIWERYHEKV